MPSGSSRITRQQATTTYFFRNVLRFFPQHRPRALRPWQQAAVQHSVRAMCQQRAALRRVGHAVRYGLYSVRHVLHAFREYARFQCSYRELKRQGREHRKQILLDRLQQAAQASQRKDTRALYQVIQQISLKLIAGKVRIRAVDGQLLTPKEEHSEILTYFQALFGTSTRKRSLKQDLKVILDQGEVEASLAKLGKAVPANGAPSSAWKYCRQVLSCPLLEAFQSETIAGYPDLWANCCLKLIPKPQKGH